MTEIHAHNVAAFKNGWKVATVTKPGSIKVASKDGPIDAPYLVGDVVLVDGSGKVVVGPISFAGATGIAHKVIECDPRTVTESQALRALAAAVIGFAAQIVAPVSTRAPALHIRLTSEETEEFHRTGRLRGSTRRFAEADLITDANDHVLKSKDRGISEGTQS